MDMTRELISPRYRSDVNFALGAQLAVGLLALLLLDGGQMARVVGVAALGFWLMTTVVIVRRPHTPTVTDLACIRWGFWPIYFAVLWVQFGL